ncbi:hypothetical protein GCM10012275_40470 [Longimycelium tulufanense]|uniref:Uncharacterized protein n=1 Tax=Longimycelium tulufanense TaxID=907463 RepID=A0A8J3FVS1_9PSEU|nr:hypothetical protein [Longimycelium tulufanense]GGM65765.1 hypothetical protein GCM10012275_40470 [Longimycelium tulufanense]
MSRALPIDRDQLRAALRELLDDPRPAAARPEVLAAVAAERQRRHEDDDGDDAPDSPITGDFARLSMLAEEVGDVARQLGPHATDPDALRPELIQVAAVALAWADRLDELDGAPF